MPATAYIDRNFSASSLELIEKANAVCEEYSAQGFSLTLRQLYYQFVARGWLPNKDTEYKRLGSVINDARLAGLLDWDYIVDRTREVNGAFGGFGSPAEAIRSVTSWYTVDVWQGQPNRVEAWVEKEALVDVLAQGVRGHRIPYFACRGYTSQSALWQAAQRIEGYLDEEGVERVVILHLGDHDPSGIDMTRDIVDRFRLFLEGDGYDPDDVEIRRIALNMDQVRQYNPPPNPAKLTDSRVGAYVARFGGSSWELDALDPTTLGTLIREHIDGEVDASLWAPRLDKEQSDKALLQVIARRWTEVEAQFGGRNGAAE
jgi:hypothetical protein